MAKMPIVRKCFVDPVLRVLRAGATPEKLACSLAIGFVVGVNPLLGTASITAIALVSILRLNVVASQTANSLVYPFQLMLFPVFLRLGTLMFHTKALPIRCDALMQAARSRPLETLRLLWSWEWHAWVVWAMFAVVAAPLLALSLRPLLAAMLGRFGAVAGDCLCTTVEDQATPTL